MPRKQDTDTEAGLLRNITLSGLGARALLLRLGKEDPRYAGQHQAQRCLCTGSSFTEILLRLRNGAKMADFWEERLGVWHEEARELRSNGTRGTESA